MTTRHELLAATSIAFLTLAPGAAKAAGLDADTLMQCKALQYTIARRAQVPVGEYLRQLEVTKRAAARSSNELLRRNAHDVNGLAKACISLGAWD